LLVTGVVVTGIAVVDWVPVGITFVDMTSAASADNAKRTDTTMVR
jgi:hypothetical protein